MTHYYLYIAAGLTIDSNTRFYKVGIGLCKILDGSGEEPAHYQAALNRHHLLMQIDPNYYTCQMLKSKKGELG